MGLKDALDRQREYRRPGPRCTVCTLIDVLDVEDRDALLGALSDQTLQSRRLADALAEEGHHVSQHSVSRHRRGDCAG